MLSVAQYFGCSPGEVLVFIATLLLVGATALLVGVTTWSVRAIRSQRKAAIRPAIILRHDLVRAVLVNVGNGIALNVSAWITQGPELLSHQCAEAIWVGDTHPPAHWHRDSRKIDLNKRYRFYISYQDADGDYHYSYRDENRLWHVGEGDIPRGIRHELVGTGHATDDRTGAWERPREA